MSGFLGGGLARKLDDYDLSGPSPANDAIQIQRDQKLIGAVGSNYGGSSYSASWKLLKTDAQLAEQAMRNHWTERVVIIDFQILPVLAA